jgi:hypothetical protein
MVFSGIIAVFLIAVLATQTNVQSQPANEQQLLDSREYKIMLNTSLFAFDKDAGIEKVVDAIRAQLEKQDGTFMVNNGDKGEQKKTVWFLDTKNHDLYKNNHFLLRVELDPKKNGEFEYDVTFKIRNADRVIAEADALSYDLSEPIVNPDSKFKQYKIEEDIVQPFASTFSASSKIEYEQAPDLDAFEDILAIYPKLDFGIPAGEILAKVNGLAATELSYDLGTLVFGNGKEAKAQLGLWYLSDDDRYPIIAEFDMDVKAEKKGAEFPLSKVGKINEFYRGLQNEKVITDANADATTKTDIAYSLAKSRES